jgi:hypothetical protein
MRSMCSPKAFLNDRETAAGLQVVSPGQGKERTMPRGRSPESVWSRFGEAIQSRRHCRERYGQQHRLLMHNLELFMRSGSLCRR